METFFTLKQTQIMDARNGRLGNKPFILNDIAVKIGIQWQKQKIY